MTAATTLDDDSLTVVPLLRPPTVGDWLPRPTRAVRRNLVARPRLIRELEQPARPLVLLTAPAGYGKTIALRQWDEASARPFAWLTPDENEREPASLAHAFAAAVSAIGTGRGRRQFVVVLDDAHLIDPQVLNAVVPIVLGWLPAGCQLAMASRCEPRLRLGRMRAERLVAELTAADLAMSGDEAEQMLAGAGLDLAPSAMAALAARTGGWPAALELAAISCRRMRQPADGAATVRGDDHLLADYFRAEILATLSPATARFLTRSSVLEQLSAALCDEVLARRRSGTVLAELERANVPLLPIDSGHESYRLDPLLREMLQAQLRRTEPELVPTLHARASEWYRRTGELDRAIEHARQAGDARRTGALLWPHLARYLGEGRNATVQRWLGGLSDEASTAELALCAAHSNLAAGHVFLAEQWARSASAALVRTPTRSTRVQRAGVLIIEAWAGRAGAQGMDAAAAHGYDLLPEDSPWRASCCFLRGSAALLTGELAKAEQLLQDGAARGAVVAPDAAALCLAQLAVIASEQDRPEAASDFARRARSIALEYELTRYPTCALVSAVGAVDAIRGRRVDEAKAAAAQCLGLIDMLDDCLSWYGAEARILLAQVALSLGDIPAARKELADASRLARRMPDAVLYSGWFDAAWNQFDTRAESALGQVATLTTAELRVLRFLPTHYSFHEIAQRLHVSSNTVKTHVHAVYRKLDASSRSQAVAHAVQAGLLGS